VFPGRHRSTQAGAAKPSALDELLSTEQEIAAQMAAAEHEASELTSAARSEAETIERNAAAALATELAALDKRDVDAREELVRKLEADGARLVARYRSLADAEVERLAAFVVSEITGLTIESGR
jgi:hypothetical protein